MKRTKRTALELQALARTLVPHDRNNDVRKAVTVVVVLVWATITVGIAYGWAVSTPGYGVLSALVWAMFGRMWGVELNDLLGANETGEQSDAHP